MKESQSALLLYFHGISSGVLCVVFGIYEKLLDSVLNFFKDIKKNTKFLLPILLGAGIGILIFSNILNYLFYYFPLQTKSIFIGLILGCIPSLIKDVNSKQPFKLRYLIFTIITFFICIFFIYLENFLYFSNNIEINYFYLVICGFVMSIGIVVPGVSSTAILMLLGIYNIYLTSLSSIYFPVLIPMGIGLIIGGIVFMILTKFLLKKFYAQTFFIIIGFTLGSIFVIIPEISFDLSGVICLLCIILGFVISKS